MKKWTLIIALSLASLVACKKEVVLPETRLDIVKSYKNIDAYMFRGVYDSLLVAELLNDSLLCKEISIENGSIKEGTSFLHKGRAEKEAILPVFTVHADTLYAIENGGMEGDKLIKIPLDKTDDYDAWTANEFPVSLYSGTVESATWVGENIFAVTMFNDDTTHFLFLVDTKGSKYTDVGFNIEDGCDEERLSKTIVYGPNSGVFYNEKLCKLAYTCGEGRYFEIMTLKNGSISDRKVVFGDMPKYKTVKEGSYILYKLACG